ncbi:hypothetical protein PMZ80_008228 [Knufia obscura]|uniref:Uncharacterized protein n=1 Tax=Knufia obscura TaxID=1635080 RepID=A0ABR0RGU2_9EURO|nr:hypothetical protein PMZ80_008228 [Knufia obscura]
MSILANQSPGENDLLFSEGDVLVKTSNDHEGDILIHSEVLRKNVPWFVPILSGKWGQPEQVGSSERKLWKLELYFDTESCMALLKHKSSKLDTSYFPPEHCPAEFEHRWNELKDTEIEALRNTRQREAESLKYPTVRPARRQFAYDSPQPPRAEIIAWSTFSTDIELSVTRHSVYPTYAPFMHAYLQALPELEYGETDREGASNNNPYGTVLVSHTQANRYWQEIWRTFIKAIYGLKIQFRRPNRARDNENLDAENTAQLLEACHFPGIAESVKDAYHSMRNDLLERHEAFLHYLQYKVKEHQELSGAEHYVAASVILAFMNGMQCMAPKRVIPYDSERLCSRLRWAYIELWRMSTKYREQDFIKNLELGHTAAIFNISTQRIVFAIRTILTRGPAAQIIKDLMTRPRGLHDCRKQQIDDESDNERDDEDDDDSEDDSDDDSDDEGDDESDDGSNIHHGIRWQCHSPSHYTKYQPDTYSPYDGCWQHNNIIPGRPPAYTAGVFDLVATQLATARELRMLGIDYSPLPPATEYTFDAVAKRAERRQKKLPGQPDIDDFLDDLYTIFKKEQAQSAPAGSNSCFPTDITASAIMVAIPIFATFAVLGQRFWSRR